MPISFAISSARSIHSLANSPVGRELLDVAVELGRRDLVRDLVDLGDQLDGGVAVLVVARRKATPP